MSARYSYDRYLQAVPADWNVNPISEISTVVGGGTPSRDVSQFWRGSIPWLTPGEVSSEESIHISATRENISKEGLRGSGATLLPPGSLMITTRATLGARAINIVPMTTNQGFKSLVFKVPSDALFYYFLVDRLKPEFVRRASGTTFLEVSGTEVGQIKVPVPPTCERALIAEILVMLDTTIRQTEAIVEKLKLVKQGLLHDLLTRGIGANGELRPPQSQAPHLYKDSPLGWIPSDWKAIRFGESIRELCQGWSPDCGAEPATLGQWGVLKTTAIVWDGYADFENKVLPASLMPRYGLEVTKNDILITRAGPTDRVAVVALVEQTRSRLMISDKMYRLRLKHQEIPGYFVLALSSRYAQAALARSISGMAESQTNISQSVINNLLLMRPPTHEQSQISDRVTVLSSRMNAEKSQLKALKKLKLGLMDDLLTGRVRVTPLL